MQNPDLIAEQELISIENHHETIVKIPRTNRTVKIGWLKNGALNKITKLILFSRIAEDSEDAKTVLKSVKSQSKIIYQTASAIILNNYWKIKFFNWIYWRFLCYWRQYDLAQLRPIIEEGKKKVPLVLYYDSMVSLISMKTTIMTMTTKEAEQYLQDARLAQKQLSEKSTVGRVDRSPSLGG